MAQVAYFQIEICRNCSFPTVVSNVETSVYACNLQFNLKIV